MAKYESHLSPCSAHRLPARAPLSKDGMMARGATSHHGATTLVFPLRAVSQAAFLASLL